MLQSVYVNSFEKCEMLVDGLKKQKRYAGCDKVYGTIFDDSREIRGFVVWYRVRK